MTFIQADARHIPLADQSVHCCITSPPYWGLRDYGTATWEGGDDGCDHKAGQAASPTSCLGSGPNGRSKVRENGFVPFRGDCGKCGARRIDNQLGLEPTPELYVANMVEVFREVSRVLRDDGTCWVNLGDSYNAYNGGAGPSSALSRGAQTTERPQLSTGFGLQCKTLKPKDLVGIPWRVAFALQADGWYLRSDIIWSKPNPMPESVTDRPTKAHEHVFLLSKRPRYYYDAEAIREDADKPTRRQKTFRGGCYTEGKTYDNSYDYTGHAPYSDGEMGAGRNRRTVWEIATQPYSEAHFATFPEKLVEPCILAGCPEAVCTACGAGWVREVEEQRPSSYVGRDVNWTTSAGRMRMVDKFNTTKITTGFAPTCTCAAPTTPGTVLDPFCGSGTTVAVARRLGRHGIGLDISAEYLEMARKRGRVTQGINFQ